MLIELSFIYLSSGVWKSKQCEGRLCPCRNYFTLVATLSQLSMTTGSGVRRHKPNPESARAESSRPQWLNHHPRHKPTQTSAIAGQHKLSRPIRARLETQTILSMKKPATPERVTGLIFQCLGGFFTLRWMTLDRVGEHGARVSDQTINQFDQIGSLVEIGNSDVHQIAQTFERLSD